MYYSRTSPRRSNYDYTSAGGYFITICTAGRQHYFGEIIDGEVKLNDLGKYCYHCWNEIPNHYPFVDIDEFVVMPNHIHGILIVGTHNGNHDGERRDVSHTSSANNTHTCSNNNQTPDKNTSYSGRRDVSHTSYGKNKMGDENNTQDANGENMEDAKYCVPTTTGIQPQSGSLGSIVRGFKIGITKYATSGIQIPYGDTFARQPRYHDRIIRNEDEYNKIKYYIQTNPQNRQKDKLYQT